VASISPTRNGPGVCLHHPHNFQLMSSNSPTFQGVLPGIFSSKAVSGWIRDVQSAVRHIVLCGLQPHL